MDSFSFLACICRRSTYLGFPTNHLIIGSSKHTLGVHLHALLDCLRAGKPSGECPIMSIAIMFPDPGRLCYDCSAVSWLGADWLGPEAGVGCDMTIAPVCYHHR